MIIDVWCQGDSVLASKDGIGQLVIDVLDIDAILHFGGHMHVEVVHRHTLYGS